MNSGNLILQNNKIALMHANIKMNKKKRMIPRGFGFGILVRKPVLNENIYFL